MLQLKIFLNESGRKPDEIGSSARRNSLGLSKSTFNRITRNDLHLTPYKILKHQKLTPQNEAARLEMGRFLSNRPNSYFERLSVSDEAWFSLGGHVFNKKNTVLYSPNDDGTPSQWFSNSAQSQKKVMVFGVLTGYSYKFGPYFLNDGVSIDQELYKRTLAYKVFPDMKRVMG